MPSPTVTRTIPQAILVVSVILLTIDYFWVDKTLSAGMSVFLVWVSQISNFAVGFGVVSIVVLHIHRIKRRERGVWPFSVWLIFMLVVVFGLGLTIGQTSVPYRWLYTNFFEQAAGMVDAILAFFIISAAYRAFRARTVNGAILLVVGIIVMLMNAPFTGVISPGLVDLGQWIFNVPNQSAQRAIIMGAALGGTILILRTLLGIERRIAE